MGYSTVFFGSFALDRQMSNDHANYIRAFSRTRRMSRLSHIAEKMPDPLREAAGLGIGLYHAEYFVGNHNDNNCGQTRDESIIDFNNPPMSQPGLWCKWTISEDNKRLEWDGSEKFYDYIRWLDYLVAHFLNLWGYKLNGTVFWQGEDIDDIGKIVITNNNVRFWRLDIAE
jgi:hypothetical protein